MQAGCVIRDTLGLPTEPVAVFLRPSGSSGVPFPDPRWRGLNGARYCQALMEARRGAFVLVDGQGLACPAAAAAFGFKALPEPLASGRGLVGFGIAAQPDVGRVMFEQMARLSSGSCGELALCPLSEVPEVTADTPAAGDGGARPDVVVVEGRPEALMWLLLADLNLEGGARRQGDTAVLQATCVDSTVIPYLERKVNFSLGCYGCREATDIGADETVVGFPADKAAALADEVVRLAAKALPNSRGKKAYAHFTAGTEQASAQPQE